MLLAYTTLQKNHCYHHKKKYFFFFLGAVKCHGHSELLKIVQNIIQEVYQGIQFWTGKDKDELVPIQMCVHQQ